MIIFFGLLKNQQVSTAVNTAIQHENDSQLASRYGWVLRGKFAEYCEVMGGELSQGRKQMVALHGMGVGCNA